MRLLWIALLHGLRVTCDRIRVQLQHILVESDRFSRSPCFTFQLREVVRAGAERIGILLRVCVHNAHLLLRVLPGLIVEAHRERAFHITQEALRKVVREIAAVILAGIVCNLDNLGGNLLRRLVCDIGNKFVQLLAGDFVAVEERIEGGYGVVVALLHLVVCADIRTGADCGHGEEGQGECCKLLACKELL